jgi:hypothetical protein
MPHPEGLNGRYEKPKPAILRAGKIIPKRD